jgi:hypothetical protein
MSIPRHRTDYLAKDYESFRQLMFDRLSASLPGWTERHPTDLGVTLVEAVAYAADRLSYYQDAVATEAYIGTARQRRSLRRHGRLIDYALHEGCNARAWVQVTVSDQASVTLDLGKIVFSASSKHDGSGGTADRQVTFRPVHHGCQTFDARFNAIEVVGRLASGATSVLLRYAGGDGPCPGDVFVLGPRDGSTTDANAYHPVLVTSAIQTTGPEWYVAWHEADALPSAKADAMAKLGAIVARGNNVLVDHGQWLEGLGVTLDPATRLGALPLTKPDITYAEPPPNRLASASAQSVQSARQALPVVTLRAGASIIYQPRFDLLLSQGTDRHFVLDWGEDRHAVLRFGDGSCGALPAANELTARVRIGNGPSGNVPAGAINTIAYEEANEDVKLLRVTNCLAAVGGTVPESSELMRLVAPGSIAAQQPRAITAADYVRFALEVEGVQNAAAVLAAEGARKVVAVAIDPIGYAVGQEGHKDSWASLRRLVQHRLEAVRCLNHDISVVAPLYVDIALRVGLDVLPGYDVADLKAKAELALSQHFAPDRLTFGTDVHWSQIVALLLRFPGVSGVRQLSFGREGDAIGAGTASTISIGPLEIVRYSTERPDEQP